MIWRAALLVLLVAGTAGAEVPCPNPARSQAVIAQFRKNHPCPTTCATYVKTDGRFVLYQKCGACQVDHVCPLACCGADAIENLQWLTADQNRAKGADCTACRLPGQQP